MDHLRTTLFKPAARLGAATQNALEVARFGGLATDEEPAPYELHSEHRVYRLRRYHAGAVVADAPPVLLIPPMMLAAEIYDVSPRTSAVTLLHDLGVDPWVIDFGAPEKQRGGLERNLTDHVLAISEAIDEVSAQTGRAVNLGGYSQGGMFGYQAAAYRRGEGVCSLITFGSPVDTRAAMPFGIPEQLATGAAAVLAERVFREWSLPAWASRTGFRLLDPVKSVRSRLDFIMQLHDREALLARERQRRFLEADGWVAWPGPAMADFLEQFIAHNRMLEGGFVVDETLVTLADIECPILSVVGTIDQIAPAAGVRAISRAAPRAEVYELAVRAGHFALVVGSVANSTTWPAVAGWVRWRAGLGERPDNLVRASAELDRPSSQETPGLPRRVAYGLGLAGQVGSALGRSAAQTARRSAGGLLELGREAAEELPRLARLERAADPSTRISLGLLVQERRRRAGAEVLFLFGDRAYTASAVNERIDAVVRGLISIGVRQGEHVGVLMETRPTALALLVAINRLGAVAVLLRPDGDLERELELGQPRRIIADPERAAQAARLAPGAAFVLGAGGRSGQGLNPGELTDMELIDPEGVVLPRWYQANPGLGRDLAFVVFTGEGATTRAGRITNSRWAISAIGTASSAALTSADTVYSVTPLHHQSALLMSVGGAIAGGSRLAMATSFDATTFWDEVRRYGVTVASYTWTMLEGLVQAPAHPGERHHAVRLFIGSGMPLGLWTAVQDRFAPARVVEFYAATDAGAILVNVSGAKPGSMGQPLPGSAEVALAAYDVAARRLDLEPGGFARRCIADQTGMLLVRVAVGQQSDASVLRSIFERGDVWLETGDLFRRDGDGDFWLLDHLGDVIETVSGPVFTGPIRDALGVLPEVALAVAYGHRPAGAADQIAVAAVTLRGDRKLLVRDLSAALGGLPVSQRPSIVYVVDQIPLSTWFKPLTGPLRDRGLPAPGKGVQAWSLEQTGRRYRTMT